VNAAHLRQEAPEGGENTVSARNGDRRVTELMSWSILTVPATMTCQEARALAATRAVHHIPVLDGGVMVGITCTCDLRSAHDAERIERRMRHPVVTISASASASEALATMGREDVGALPVLYHGFLIGIVTTGDLVRARVLAEAERLVCRSCRAHHHVRAVPVSGVLLCLTCRERRGR